MLEIYKKARILFVSTGLNVGGAETILTQLLKNLAKDFDIEVVSLTGHGKFADEIKEYGIKVHIINLKKIYFLFFELCKFFKIICKFKPDIIQGWMYHGNLFAFLGTLFLFKKCKLYFAIRCSLPQKFFFRKFLSLSVFSNSIISSFADKIIYNSYFGKISHENYFFCNKKSTVIHNGINTELFVPSITNHKLLCDELKISHKSFLIGIIGNFRPVKDHATFIHAAGILLRKEALVHFVMVGKGVHDSNKQLKKLINKYPNLDDHIHLLGSRKDVPYITSALDIANNCSLSEGFSNCIGEALSCEVPCVVTDVGESASIVGDRRFILPVKSHEQFVGAWCDILSMSKKKRSQYGHMARKKMEKLYSLDKMIYKYRHIYSREI